MGIGRTTINVLRIPQYTLKPHKAAEIVWKMKCRNIAPNGAIMRNGIVCTYEYWNEEVVLNNCETIAKLTHFDPRCVDSCKIMAHIILGELNEKPLKFEALEGIISTYDDRILPYLQSPDASIEKLELDSSESLGYTLKALNSGIWSYYNSTDFLSSLQAIIMEGGDADTNASVVGSILGAKFGYSNLPKHLIETLNEKEKLEKYSDEYIAELERIKQNN